MAKIFISHSSMDKEFVFQLTREIQSVLGIPESDVFASTMPKAISIGESWFDKVMSVLEDATVLILLQTRGAENSAWVGFELGYFWKKTNRENILVLRHPKSRLASPIDVIQAKSILERDELENFFIELCKIFGESYSNRANLEQLLVAADALPNPMAERSLERFENLIVNAEWSENSFGDLIENWVCMEDMLFQIERDINRDLISDRFEEPWAKDFPDPHTASYTVHLKIAGVTVHQEVFVGLDSGRYFVPIPEIKIENPHNYEEDTRTFYWNKNSLRFKLGKLIGRFYFRGHTIYDFAEMRNILIVEESI